MFFSYPVTVTKDFLNILVLRVLPQKTVFYKISETDIQYLSRNLNLIFRKNANLRKSLMRTSYTPIRMMTIRTCECITFFNHSPLMFSIPFFAYRSVLFSPGTKTLVYPSLSPTMDEANAVSG